MEQQASKKKFTIIVCTYNGERTLEKCLDALLALKGLEKVQEIKVVDNNSTDGTKEIIFKYSLISSLIKYEFEERQGLTYARQHAVNSVTPWVIYVDDDNILDSLWIEELTKEISSNSVGVINGAVIAKAINAMNETEDAILHAMFFNLACTHLGEPHVHDTNRHPMGAGMCIRTDALKYINDSGWLNLEGRKGKELSSGEDTELCSKVFSQGYLYLFNPKMKLYHLISNDRLKEEYCVELIHGLVKGRVQFLVNMNTPRIYMKMRKIKHLYKYITSYFKIVFCRKNQYMYWKNRVNYLQAKEFINLL